MNEYSISFVCQGCGDHLPTEIEEDSIWCREYHSCFGERVGMVAMLFHDSISVQRDGIEIEVDDE